MMSSCKAETGNTDPCEGGPFETNTFSGLRNNYDTQGQGLIMMRAGGARRENEMSWKNLHHAV